MPVNLACARAALQPQELPCVLLLGKVGAVRGGRFRYPRSGGPVAGGAGGAGAEEGGEGEGSGEEEAGGVDDGKDSEDGDELGG